MPVEWLFRWWNAVYTIPLAFVLIFLAVTSLVSLIGGGLGELTQGNDTGAETEAGADADADAELDVEADLDADVDADVDADIDAEADVSGAHHAGDGCVAADLNHDGHVSAAEHAVALAHGHGSDPGLLVGSLVFLGVGRAPLVMLLQILLLLWGLIGLALHQTLNAAGPLALAWSVPLTLLLSVLGTRSFAVLFGRFFRQKETYALKRNDLLGRTGKVVYDVTPEEGTVNVRDQYGNLHRIRARSLDGRLESGQEIVVVGYDSRTNLYQVDDSVTFVNRS